MIPRYQQRLKQQPPAFRTAHRWSDQSDATLRDCFEHVDWDAFRAAGGLSDYTDTVCSFIRKCTEDVVPATKIKIWPNQKAWINSDVRAALQARTTALKSGTPEEYKQARYTLRATIKKSKREFGKQLESKLDSSNPRHLWRGLHAASDFKGGKQQTPTTPSPTLPDELNAFYARFDPSARPPDSPPPPTPHTEPGGEDNRIE